jgi:hypothetical protein
MSMKGGSIESTSGGYWRIIEERDRLVSVSLHQEQKYIDDRAQSSISGSGQNISIHDQWSTLEGLLHRAISSAEKLRKDELNLPEFKASVERALIASTELRCRESAKARENDELRSLVSSLREVVQKQREALAKKHGSSKSDQSSQTFLTCHDVEVLHVDGINSSTEKPPKLVVVNSPLEELRARNNILESKLIAATQESAIQASLIKVLNSKVDRLEEQAAASETALSHERLRVESLGRVIRSMELIAANEEVMAQPLARPQTRASLIRSTGGRPPRP